jgi:hypothetical protein
MALVAASGGLSLLAAASVKADQGAGSRFRDLLEVHGKEKVYGSIP